MAKIFIDTDILPKAFRKLEPSLKLAWYYVWTHCDKSGVWEIDEDLFEFENGIEFEGKKLVSALPGLVVISGNKILLPDFIKINYGTLTDNYNPHKPVFRDMAKNNVKLEPSLNQAYFKLVEEEEDVYEEEDEEEDENKKGGMGEKKVEDIPELDLKVQTIQPKKIDYEEVVRIFNSVCVSFPKVEVINDGRKRSIKKIWEKFGAEKIGTVFKLSEESEFMKGNSTEWKASFDWIMNEKNFIKILEGNYKNKENGAGKQKSTTEQFVDAINSDAARNFRFSP